MLEVVLEVVPPRAVHHHQLRVLHLRVLHVELVHILLVVLDVVTRRALHALAELRFSLPACRHLHIFRCERRREFGVLGVDQKNEPLDAAVIERILVL